METTITLSCGGNSYYLNIFLQSPTGYVYSTCEIITKQKAEQLSKEFNIKIN